MKYGEVIDAASAAAHTRRMAAVAASVHKGDNDEPPGERRVVAEDGNVVTLQLWKDSYGGLMKNGKN